MSENHDSAAMPEPDTTDDSAPQREELDLDFLPQEVRDALDRIQSPADYNALAEFYVTQNDNYVSLEMSSEDVATQAAQALSKDLVIFRKLNALQQLELDMTRWFTQYAPSILQVCIANAKVRTASSELTIATGGAELQALATAAFDLTGSELEQLDHVRQAVTPVLARNSEIQTAAQRARDAITQIDDASVSRAIEVLNGIFAKCDTAVQAAKTASEE